MTAHDTLFEVDDERALPKPAPTPATLFADIVFDRPLDHAYTYAVPEALVARIGVGKRVEVPFGKGGKAPQGSACASPTFSPLPVTKSKLLPAYSTTTPSLTTPS